MSAPKPRARTVCAEDVLLGRIAAILAEGAPPPAQGELSIGDDAAVVAAPAGHLVLSVDSAVDGVHADLADSSLEDLGFKAVTAAVSDLAAMGADPLCALVALCVPPGPDAAEVATRLAQGAAAASTEWGSPVIGGDLTSASEVVVTVTVVGSLGPGAGSPGGPLTRAGAAPGDVLLVTGPLGAAAAGLRIVRSRPRPPGAADVAGIPARTAAETPAQADAVAAHRRPRARLAEGRVARLVGASAAMDLSDGLGLDLHRLADASGVGVVVDVVPVAPVATLEEALGGGDDYELLVATADPDGLRAAFGAAGLREPIVIGRCVEDVAVRTLAGEPLAPTGWQMDLGG